MSKGTDPREVTVTGEVARSGKEETVTFQSSSLAQTCWGGGRSLDSHSTRVHPKTGKAGSMSWEVGIRVEERW